MRKSKLFPIIASGLIAGAVMGFAGYKGMEFAADKYGLEVNDKTRDIFNNIQKKVALRSGLFSAVLVGGSVGLLQKRKEDDEAEKLD